MIINSVLSFTSRSSNFQNKRHNADSLYISDFVPVIQSLVALVHDPEPEHPLRADLAEEFTKDKKKFMRNAEEHVKKAWFETTY